MYCREAAQLMGRYVLESRSLIKTHTLKLTSTIIVFQALAVTPGESIGRRVWRVVTLLTTTKTNCSKL
jgi:hypothetical protein